jgi:hypothetical protein
MADPVRASLEAVVDEASFVVFLKTLGEDWERARQLEQAHPSSPYGPNATGWENGTIGAFLESASAWAEASAQGPRLGYRPPTNSWRRCADIIFMGKIYE